MESNEKFKLVSSIAEEIITSSELSELLKTKKHPIAYDGFEPSGLAHLPVGVYRPLLIKDLIKAGIHFKLLLADTFAWINNKMDGDLERIRDVGRYFVEVWKAAGVDMNKIELIWHKDMFGKAEYQKRVLTIAKSHTAKRTLRALSIAGRQANLDNPAAVMFYPSMQAADIFELEADIAQLGLDQRKVNVLARDVAGKNGWKKPIALHHHMLLGLTGPQNLRGYDENKSIDAAISSKMSKSKVDTSIFVHDTDKQIFSKIKKAYCPIKIVEGNPILDYTKEIIFRAFNEFTVERKKEFGGDIVYSNYQTLEKDYVKGNLHPMDLKKALAVDLDKLIKPIRNHFEKNKKAKKLYSVVKEYNITR